MLLALDTSTTHVTVALVDGDVLVAERARDDGLRHAEVLAPLIEQTLADAGVTPGQLTRIVVGVGPGPFTGLRVGLVTAYAMAHALSIPVDGVVSHDAIACGEPGDCVVVTDARRREVYWARYRDGVRVDGPGVGPPDALEAQLAPGTRVLGPGPGPVTEPRRMTAHGLARASLAGGALAAQPMYLRRPDAAPPGPAKPVLAR